jgi:potassium-transporting ATPase KdpC subunit
MARMGVIEMQKILTSIRVFLVFAILLGLIYPLLIMVLGQAMFPYQAKGSLLTYRGKVIGSALIAQAFTSHKYFHSRFSAVNYDAANSGASNLAVSNLKLYQEVQAHIKHVKTENNLDPELKLPADMVLSSASGLDPHISLANAMLQLPRVAGHRSLSNAMIKHLIYDHLDRNFIGLWGQAGVNVLQLNLALDKFEEKHLQEAAPT